MESRGRPSPSPGLPLDLLEVPQTSLRKAVHELGRCSFGMFWLTTYGSQQLVQCTAIAEGNGIVRKLNPFQKAQLYAQKYIHRRARGKARRAA